MSLVNSVLPMTNAKDSRWLTLEVCREYQRNKCSRSENECKFAHPPPHVEVNNGRVVCCFDSLKNRCNRNEPPCKYLHPPSHLRDQLLQNGRNNLILKNIQMGMLQQALLHQSGLLQLGPYMPLAATAAPNLPQPPYIAGGNSPFLGGASPLPLISPAPASDPGLFSAASPAAAAAAAVAGLTPMVPNNIAAAAAAAVGGQQMKTMQPNCPTSFNLVHPTSASPVAANSMFGPTAVPSSAHASFVAAAAAALQANQQHMKGLAPYTSMPAKGRPTNDGIGPTGGPPVGAGAENGIGGGGGGGCPVSIAGGPPASLLAAAAVASMNSQPTAAALQQAMTASFQQSHGATPPAAALATMQLPTGQQAYIPAHPGPGDFSPFTANAGHPSAIHRF